MSAEIKNWPIPTNSEQFMSFLGFVGFYRKFIQNFSRIARHLIDVIDTGKKTKGKQQNSPKWKCGN